ncbi:MAG: type II secretion system protein GspG [Planctomycetales bacterium]|nr:type II secretion system protein GspG [Planctomycetales bacterium]
MDWASGDVRNKHDQVYWLFKGIVKQKTDTSSKAEIDATKTQLQMLKNSVSMFQIRMNSLPKSLKELRDGPSDPAKKARWVAPIIADLPKDSWDNDFHYKVNGKRYEIRSRGPDGKINTDDDIKPES